ncbi:MAG: hypothetical protein Q9165_006254 [Trypethelium subeluteriae]
MIHEKSSSHLDVTIPGPPPFDQTAASQATEDNTFADIFDSSPLAASPHSAPAAEPSEIPRLRSTHTTAGYRDGISSSKVRYVQDGFDEGYSLGATIGLKAGFALGVVESLVKALGRRRLNVRKGLSSNTTMTPGSDQSVDGEKERSRLNQREDLERKRGQMLAEAEELRAEAATELAVQRLFGRQYFGEDGVWTYDVPGEEEEVTFEEIANAHPLIQKWTKGIRDLVAAWGVDLDACTKVAQLQDEG